MLNKIKLFFNDYSERILLIIIIVAGIIIVNRFLNEYTNTDKKSSSSSTNQETSDYGNDISMLTNEKVSTKTYEQNKSTILQFVDYCISDPYSAYLMLTDSSKEMFSSYEDFRKNYVNVYFTSQMTATPKSYMDNIYLVELREDVMATGEYTDTYVEEYITIDEVDNTKVNIKGLIKKVDLDRYSKFDNIELQFSDIKYYTDYSCITLTVHNLNDEKVYLDNSSMQEGISCVTDSGLIFPYIIEKTVATNLELEPYEQKEITLYFTQTFGYKDPIKAIEISNVLIGETEVLDRYIYID